jgi:hypothetical protein
MEMEFKKLLFQSVYSFMSQRYPVTQCVEAGRYESKDITGNRALLLGTFVMGAKTDHAGPSLDSMWLPNFTVKMFTLLIMCNDNNVLHNCKRSSFVGICSANSFFCVLVFGFRVHIFILNSIFL